MSSIRSKRGGRATTAKRFEDTVLNITETAMLLKCSVSRVRQRSEAGELPVLGWDGDKPFFKAGDIMALSPS